MNGDNLKASCELSKFIETLISLASLFKGSPTTQNLGSQHNKVMHKFNSDKTCKIQIQTKAKTLDHTENKWAIGSKVTKPCTSEWLALLLNALFFLLTAYLPSRQTETASFAGYWTCLRISRRVNSVVRVFFALMQNLGVCCIKQKEI